VLLSRLLIIKTLIFFGGCNIKLSKIIKLAIVILVILVICGASLSAQLLNSSFENWDLLGNPVNWTAPILPGGLTPIVQSNDAHEGSFAAKLEVVDYLGIPYSGALQSIDSENQFGHPISERFSQLSGYYKFFPTGAAQLLIVVSVYDVSFMLIGVGGIDVFDSANNWTQFNIPIEYIFSTEAASIIVTISITDSSSSGIDPNTLGAIALIDNLTLGNPTHISEKSNVPLNYSLSQNYPNPFNPSTIIKYSIPSNGKSKLPNVTLKIYDVLGREITRLVNEQQGLGNYRIVWNAVDQASGIYFYAIQIGNFSETKKMILQK